MSAPTAGWQIKLVDGTRYLADEMSVEHGVLRFTGRISDPATGPRGAMSEYVFSARALAFARRAVTS